jgi:hypothetical protein
MKGMWLSAVAVSGAVLLTGCTMSPCSSGPQPSGGYRVTAHEPYDEQSQFTFSPTWSRDIDTVSPCGGPFGAGVGSQVEFSTMGAVDAGNYCTVGYAELTATSSTDAALFGPSDNHLAYTQVRSDNAFFFAVEDVQIGTCRGTLAFEVIRGRTPDGLFSTPVPGQYPPVVLYRLFFPDDGMDTNCPMCDDAFVAEIEPVAAERQYR